MSASVGHHLGRTVLVIALALACPFSHADEVEPPYLEAQGEGEASAPAERASVGLGVSVQRPTAREAQQEANRVGGRVLEALRGAGVPEAQIQTSQLQLQPIYASRDRASSEPQEPRVIAYRASNVVRVRIEDLARLGPAIDAGLGAGANRLEGISFGVRNEGPLRSRALAEAVRDARAKARTMAEALDVPLGRVQSVHEGGVGVRAPEMHARLAAASADNVGTPIAAGEIQVRASVRVRWRLGD